MPRWKDSLCFQGTLSSCWVNVKNKGHDRVMRECEDNKPLTQEWLNTEKGAHKSGEGGREGVSRVTHSKRRNQTHYIPLKDRVGSEGGRFKRGEYVLRKQVRGTALWTRSLQEHRGEDWQIKGPVFQAKEFDAEAVRNHLRVLIKLESDIQFSFLERSYRQQCRGLKNEHRESN